MALQPYPVDARLKGFVMAICDRVEGVRDAASIQADPHGDIDCRQDPREAQWLRRYKITFFAITPWETTCQPRIADQLRMCTHRMGALCGVYFDGYQGLMGTSDLWVVIEDYDLTRVETSRQKSERGRNSSWTATASPSSRNTSTG